MIKCGHLDTARIAENKKMSTIDQPAILTAAINALEKANRESAELTSSGGNEWMLIQKQSESIIFTDMHSEKWVIMKKDDFDNYIGECVRMGRELGNEPDL